MSNRNSRPSSPIPEPPPLPPHPKQAQRIANQAQLERIDPPKIKFKTSQNEDNEKLERIDPPKVKFKTFYKENEIDNRSVRNTSPGTNLKKSENIQTNPITKNSNKKEELIEAPYLRRILSNEANIDNNQNPTQQEQMEYATDVPICCYSSPCINYINGCKEIKKTINYGRRVQTIDTTPCNHYLIGNETCEKCCKLITINRNLFSLHCAWHHQLLTCFICKMTISDLEHRVYRGKVHCGECFKRVKGLHGQELRTVHKRA